MRNAIFTLAILSLFTFSRTAAQAPDWAWAKSTGGSNYEQAYKVGTDAAGNVYIAGTFESPTVTFGSTTLTNTGSSDMFVAKYDANGNILWAHSAAGAGNDGVYGMTTDAAGNVYVCGYFNSSTLSFDGTDIIKGGASDAYIVKYNTQGNVVWARQSGSSGYDQMQNAAVDSKGNVYVCGIYQSASFIIGSITLPNAGDNDSFIAKYDSAGNVIWAKQAAGNSWNNVYDIGVDITDNPYISGYFGGASMAFGSITVSNSSSSSTFVAKYDANGTALWAKSSTGSGSVFQSSLAVDRSGNAFISGFFNGTMQVGAVSLTSTGGSDLFVVKYDTNGNVSWAKSATGSGDEYGYDLATDATGNVYATGYFGSSNIDFGGATLTNSGVIDIFVVKYDTSGLAAWAINPSGSIDEMGQGIAIDGSGNIIVSGGFYSSSTTFGNTTLSNGGNWDLFVAKLGTNACNITTPTITASGVTSFCQGDSVVLTSSAASSYLWSNNATTQAITVKSAGSYSVVASAGGGCSATSLATVVNVTNGVPPTLSATDSLICASDSTIITASGSYTSYLWNTGDTTSFTTAKAAGGYWVTVSDANGCSAVSARLPIAVHPSVSVSIIVQGDTLTSFGAVAYQWFENNNPIQGATSPVYVVQYSGNYSVEVVDANGCTTRSNPIEVITGIENLAETNLFDIYPNPASKFAVIKVNAANSPGECRIYNTIGQLIQTVEINREQVIPVENLSAGVYYITLQSGNRFITKKLAVHHP